MGRDFGALLWCPSFFVKRDDALHLAAEVPAGVQCLFSHTSPSQLKKV